MNPIYSDQTIGEVLRLLKLGIGPVRIKALTGVSMNTICNIQKRNGIKPRSSILRRSELHKLGFAVCPYESKRDEIQAIYMQGIGFKSIAKRFGFSKVGLYKWLTKQPFWKTRESRVAFPFMDSQHIAEQKEAFIADQAHMLMTDESKHWWNHPVVYRHMGTVNALRNQKRYRQDPKKRIVYALRLRLWKTIKSAGGLKSSDSFTLAGCSRAELLKHIESQFKRGMQWNNYGKVWEVDHIQPCSSFDLTNPSEQRKCFHFSNLRPLGVSANRRKHAALSVPQLTMAL